MNKCGCASSRTLGHDVRDNVRIDSAAMAVQPSASGGSWVLQVPSLKARVLAPLPFPSGWVVRSAKD